MSPQTQSEFDALAAFSGDPGQFWPRFRAHAQQLFRAEGSCVLIQPQGGGIRSLTQSSPQAAQRVVDSGVVSSLEKMTDGALHEWAGNVLVMALPAATGSRLWLLLLDAALEKRTRRCAKCGCWPRPTSRGVENSAAASRCSG